MVAGRFNTQFNQTTCKECQVDTYSPLSSHDKACVDCPNGYEASIQSSSCTICAAGKAGTPCTGCSFGQFRGSNDLPTSCIDCPSGFYQGAEDSASCLACTPGQYQLGVGSTNCKVCDVGTFGNVSELLDCHLCPPGTHQDVSGQASCLPCIRKCCLLNDCKNRTQQLTTPPPVNNTHFYFTTTAGRFNTQFNQTTCKECQVDTYSPLSSHDEVCVDCPNGYEASLQSSSSCTICAAGKAGTPCVGCLVGQFRGSNDS
jgi:hypothetical protein